MVGVSRDLGNVNVGFRIIRDAPTILHIELGLGLGL